MSGSLLERLRAALAPQYEVERELGAGGMAVVYQATDLETGRDVALKLMKSSVMN